MGMSNEELLNSLRQMIGTVVAGHCPSHIEVVLAERCRSSEELHNPDGIMLMYADSGH